MFCAPQAHLMWPKWNNSMPVEALVRDVVDFVLVEEMMCWFKNGKTEIEQKNTKLPKFASDVLKWCYAFKKSVAFTLSSTFFKCILPLRL